MDDPHVGGRRKLFRGGKELEALGGIVSKVNGIEPPGVVQQGHRPATSES